MTKTTAVETSSVACRKTAPAMVRRRHTPRVGKRFRVAVCALVVGVLSACESHQSPENREDASLGQAYSALYRDPAADVQNSSGFIDAQRCRGGVDTAADGDGIGKGGALASNLGIRGAEVLSVGDLVEIFVEQDDTFTRSYVVGVDGNLRIPFAGPIRAAGLSPAQVEVRLADLLVREELYDTAPRVSVLLTDYAEAAAFVSGAVFEPRQVIVGGADAQTRDPERQRALGAATTSRTLSAALRNAGGVRPDADLSRVRIDRGGQQLEFDIRNAVAGRAFPDPILISGDRIEVPSRDCFQDELMVPSSVTPPGVKVFLSNLSETALGNAQAAVPDAREMRYGTRYLQAVFGLNCVGGSKLTNANRRAVLFSRNPMTGESIVIDRSIESLLRDADRDEFNPYILPEDAMACYDSSTISLKNLATALGVGVALAAVSND